MTRAETRRALAGVAVAVAWCALVLCTASAAFAAPKWTLRQLPPRPIGDGSSYPAVLQGVSCPSESLCVAVGAFDTVAFSQQPTGSADRWHVVNPAYDKPKQSCLEDGESEEFCSQPRGSLRAVSCATESLCVAVGYEGNVFTSTDPTGGAKAWSVGDVNEGPGASHLTGVSCPSASLCVAVSGIQPPASA